MPIERCCVCDDPTGHAGAHEDSHYCDKCAGDNLQCGPFCDDCWQKHVDSDLTRAGIDTAPAIRKMHAMVTEAVDYRQLIQIQSEMIQAFRDREHAHRRGDVTAIDKYESQICRLSVEVSQAKKLLGIKT